MLTAAQLARALSRLVFVVLVARVLGPEQFGVYTLLLAVVEITAVLSGMGYGDYVSREAAKDARRGWGAGEQLTWLRIAYAIPLAAIAVGLLSMFGYPRLILMATAGMSFTLVPRSVTESVQGVLRGLGECRAYLVPDLVLGFVLLVGAGALLVRGGGIYSVITIELAAAMAAGAAAVGTKVRLRTKERICLKWSALLRKSVIFNIYPFVTNLYDRIDVLLLSGLRGTTPRASMVLLTGHWAPSFCLMASFTACCQPCPGETGGWQRGKGWKEQWVCYSARHWSSCWQP